MLSNKVKMGVIILNYMAYQATINCIQDFLSLEQKNVIMKIVVVDNNSGNDSVEILSRTFKDDKRIIIVRTDKNIGFARGNNYGYNILTQNFHPDFTVISNDDILLPDKNLFNWILQSMRQYDFAVLGPSVYSIQGRYYQSPMENFPINKNECIKRLLKFYISLIKVRFKIITYKNSSIIRKRKMKDCDYHFYTEKKTLHGSFLVFSSKYFKYYNEPFDNGTFLYMEENILRIRCNNKNLKMVYSPEYCVNHLQAVSTNMVNKNQLIRDYKRIKNIINSLKYYISLL